jgi:prophage antirepressor-like protein
MTNKMQIFDFNQSPVRLIEQDGQMWFVAGDVCRVLEIANNRDAVSDLDEDEVNTVAIPDGIRGNPNKLIISESGLYSLIFKSRKPQAKVFRKWVTGEVLPAIRKDGRYSVKRADRVQEILEQAIVDVYQGNLSLEKADAIASLAGQYFRNASKSGHMTMEVQGGEVSDFRVLVATLWAKGALRKWTSREIREVALAEGLFSEWLTKESVDGPSVWSRFGLLCDRFIGNVFEGIRFERHGANRQRHFILRK